MRRQTRDNETYWSSTTTSKESATSDTEPKYELVDYGEAKHYAHQSIASATPIRSSLSSAHFFYIEVYHPTTNGFPFSSGARAQRARPSNDHLPASQYIPLQSVMVLHGGPESEDERDQAQNELAGCIMG